MGRVADFFSRLTDRLEAKNKELRRQHGLPEDTRVAEYREKKYREKYREYRDSQGRQ